MQKHIIEKIDRILEGMGNENLHIPPTENGTYFNIKNDVYSLEHILSTNQAFVTGMAMHAYVYTGDEKYLNWCIERYEAYKAKVCNRLYDTSRDVGILYWLYSVPLYKYTKDERMKELGLSACDALVSAYIPNLGFIKAWGRADNNISPYVSAEESCTPFFSECRGLLHIDTMMNLPLLVWAGDETRQPIFTRTADCHLDKTVKFLLRNDGSVRDGFRFEEFTHFKDLPHVEENYKGYSIGSYRAFGAAIAAYALSHMQRFSGNPEKVKYLNMALRFLNPLVNECESEIPNWDFRAPEYAPDTAAAAVILCTIHQIQKYIHVEKLDEYEKILTEKLRQYLDFSDEMDGFLTEQNGRHEYGVLGDYFITEAFLKTDIW